MAGDYTGQNMASAMKTKIMETPPIENKFGPTSIAPWLLSYLTRREARGFSVKVEMRRGCRKRLAAYRVA